jgi:L-iditol 2-dehydrogenase
MSTSAIPESMTAARLHGPSDLRVETVPHPGLPGIGRALLRVCATGICGSDLHSFADARIGDTRITSPLVLGHEFSAVVEDTGGESLDGNAEPLIPGTRVAVDPAQPCGRCELCEKGHPNLCRRLHFCGNYPDGGSFCQWMHMPARSCFPIPDSLDEMQGALLEPLGVAIHAVELARTRVGDSAAVLGAGPIGLLILQMLKLAGADPIFVSDRFPWRLRLAEKFGATAVSCDSLPAERINALTAGRGVDLAIEAAWADTSVDEAARMCRLGGRLVLVGIPSDDRLFLKHSTARRKGLTILLSRRMKHTYPRAIRLAMSGKIDLHGIVSHRFPLARVPEAFALNAAYADGVVKIIIKS